MKAYKVLTVKDNRYFSAVYGYDFTTEYFINQWVRPKNPLTRLFTFKHLEDAKEYNSEFSSGAIFECEIDGGIEFYPAYFFHDINTYWQLVNKNIKNKKNLKKTNISKIVSVHEDMPSILTRGIKLIKEV